MKMAVRRYGIGPCIDTDGRPTYVMIEVDAAGEIKGPVAYNNDRDVLVKAIEHLHGVFDDRIEWVDRSAPGASVLSLVPSLPKGMST